MDWCNRWEYKAIKRIINRHIISFIMDGCNRCEYKSTNKSNQLTHDIIHGGIKYECN